MFDLATSHVQMQGYSTDTVSEIHAEAPQATASKGLAQGPYVVARVGTLLSMYGTFIAPIGPWLFLAIYL